MAPAVRIEYLWTELLRRASEEGEIHGNLAPGPECRWAGVGQYRYIGLTNWRLLLNRIGDALNEAGDSASGNDLKQLASLCEKMDTEAFLPLRSEELTGSAASRLVQLQVLVDDSVTRMIDRGIADAKDKDGKPLYSGAGTLYWGRYLNLSSVTCMLRLAPMSWAKHRATPVWLQVGFKGSPPITVTRKALSPIDSELGRVVSQGNFVDVAIDLPTGAERETVMEEIVQQVARVSELLTSLESDR